MLDDVKELSAYKPSGAESKGGAMLYTFSYDVKSRNNGTSGTGHPDGTWTKTIHEYLAAETPSKATRLSA